MATAPAPSAAQAFERLVLFDGVCNFCNDTVNWLIERDPQARLRFAPLQGPTAAALRERHAEIPEDIDTIVFVDASGGVERVHLRFQAVLRVWREVEPDRALPRWLLRVPRPLMNLAYAIFASLRYRIFGRSDACRVPSPEERSRFLD